MDKKCLKSLLDCDFWRKVIIKQEVRSTNDFLKKLALQGAEEGIVICALRQKSGRGRHGRQWYSPIGGAWFSFLLRPPIDPQETGCISVLVSIALAESLNKAYSLEIKTKWPNDLILHDRKLGGILIETATGQVKLEHLIGGVGINVANPLPANTKIPPTNLAENMSKSPDLGEIIAHSLNGIHTYYKSFLKEGFYPIIKKWEGLSTVLGKVVMVKRYGEDKSYKAKAVGLSLLGELIVEPILNKSCGRKIDDSKEDLGSTKKRWKLSYEEVSLIGGE